MHQIRFRLGLRSRPRWGAYSAPPDPLAGFKEGERRERKGRGKEGRERPRDGKERGKGMGSGREGFDIAWPDFQLSVYATPLLHRTPPHELYESSQPAANN